MSLREKNNRTVSIIFAYEYGKSHFLLYIEWQLLNSVHVLFTYFILFAFSIKFISSSLSEVFQIYRLKL